MYALELLEWTAGDFKNSGIRWMTKILRINCVMLIQIDFVSCSGSEGAFLFCGHAVVAFADGVGAGPRVCFYIFNSIDVCL